MTTKQEVIEDILDHTVRQKESDGILSSEQIQHMLNVLGRTDIKIITITGNEKYYYFWRIETYERTKHHGKRKHRNR